VKVGRSEATVHLEVSPEDFKNLMAKVDYIYANVIEYNSALLAWPSVQASDDPWVDELAMAAGTNCNSLERAIPSPVNYFASDLDAEDFKQVSPTVSANQFVLDPLAPEFVRVDANDEPYRATLKTIDRDLFTPDVNDELYRATPEVVDKELCKSSDLGPDLEHRCASSELLLSRLLQVWEKDEHKTVEESASFGTCEGLPGAGEVSSVLVPRARIPQGAPTWIPPPPPPSPDYAPPPPPSRSTQTLKRMRRMTMSEFLCISDSVKIMRPHIPEVRPVLAIMDGVAEKEEAVLSPDFYASGGGDDWMGVGLGWATRLVAEKRPRFPQIFSEVYQTRIIKLLAVLRDEKSNADKKRWQILLRVLESEYCCKGGGKERLLRSLDLYEELAKEGYNVLCEHLDDAGDVLDYKMSLQ
jgi:hypothetical protein